MISALSIYYAYSFAQYDAVWMLGKIGMLPNINSYYHFALIALDVDPASWYLATVEGAIRD